jgi:hypothetical protein
VGGTCDTHGRGLHGVLVGRPEGKRPVGIPGLRYRITLRWASGR